MKTKKLFPVIAAAALLGACSPSAQPSAPEKTTNNPKVTSSVSAKPTTPTASPSPTVAFTPKDHLSEAQNSFVKQVMEKNHYDQRTAEIVLGPVQSLCGLLDTKQPDSAANKQTLSDIYTKVDSAELRQEWYNNLQIAGQTLCPDKAQIINANKPEGVS
ncbi:hypothetical protein [Varibaculum cambriense]|uniref:hypothetical protein n=1 Tax=Varibaculum cambriense TaxID=184870 RepID=UPI00241C7097|nr:hypothetical protein [Varibaculum cambriense]MBS5944297.1 hypothetical protein [Varibaculum cambriense]MDU7407866.1 hypothetical protein [Varibaculum cambriense]